MPSLICLLLLAGCVMPGDAAPVVKIGLIAPFEGSGRPLGYAVLPAVKAAAAEANASGELGRYQVSVVAYNDDLHGATAAAQAKALALDLEVLAVVGPWTAETAAAAEPILAEAGFSLGAAVTSGVVVPEAGETWSDAVLAQAAAQADARTRAILAALADDIRLNGQPTRGGVAAGLQRGG